MEKYLIMALFVTNSVLGINGRSRNKYRNRQISTNYALEIGTNVRYNVNKGTKNEKSTLPVTRNVLFIKS